MSVLGSDLITHKHGSSVLSVFKCVLVDEGHCAALITSALEVCGNVWRDTLSLIHTCLGQFRPWCVCVWSVCVLDDLCGTLSSI